MVRYVPFEKLPLNENPNNLSPSFKSKCKANQLTHNFKLFVNEGMLGSGHYIYEPAEIAVFSVLSEIYKASSEGVIFDIGMNAGDLSLSATDRSLC